MKRIGVDFFPKRLLLLLLQNRREKKKKKNIYMNGNKLCPLKIHAFRKGFMCGEIFVSGLQIQK